MTRLWKTLKEAVIDFVNDDALTQAGAVAFYSALSLAPLLLLFLAITSVIGQSAQDGIISAIERIVGPSAADGIGVIIKSAGTPQVASVAGVIGVLTLIYSASGVFAQLQWALNSIWDVHPRPGNGLWNWLRKRLLSIGMIFVMLLLLLMSLIASSVMLTLANTAQDILPVAEKSAGWLPELVNTLVQAVIFVALFALMFRYLPDVRIAWKDVMIGAVMTAVLFIAGKFAISMYLSRSVTESAYGAAGSLIALLLWVYYSALILFFGAEMTQAWVQSGGRSITPENGAERVGDKAMSEEEHEHADGRGRPIQTPIKIIHPSRPVVGWKPVLAGVVGLGVALTMLRKSVL